jgi:hypothetical protein
MRNYREEHDAILADFSASYWLKDAMRALDKRDPLDALHDANTLVDLAEQRCRAAMAVA